VSRVLHSLDELLLILGVIPAILANPKSHDWRRPNAGISGVQKLVQIVLFLRVK